MKPTVVDTMGGPRREVHHEIEERAGDQAAEPESTTTAANRTAIGASVTPNVKIAHTIIVTNAR